MVPRKNSSQPMRGVALVGGILIVMLGLGLLGNELNSLGWRLKALLFYKEGAARIMSTQILEREGVFEVETTYRLEWDGRTGKNTATLDPDDPWVSTREEAIRRQNRLAVGEVYPCWYAPGAPEAENVLAPEGLQLANRSLRLSLPMVIIAVGVCFIWLGRKGLIGRRETRGAA